MMFKKLTIIEEIAVDITMLNTFANLSKTLIKSHLLFSTLTKRAKSIIEKSVVIQLINV